MSALIRVPENLFHTVEKRLKYRFWDKERERSNRAAGMHAAGVSKRCPMRHINMAWSGPPHDTIRAYICLDCHAAASEPEIKDRGCTFEEVPDWTIHEIFDLDLERQSRFVSHPK